MTSGILSYRLTPVYIAISFALAIPQAQASCVKGKDASCYSFSSGKRIAFNLGDVEKEKTPNNQGLYEWSPNFSIEQDVVINSKLNNYAVKLTNSGLALVDNNPMMSKNALDIIKRAENRYEKERSLVINGGQQINAYAKSNSAISIVTNKVVVKTTGNESKGIYYLDHSDANTKHNENAAAKLAVTAVGLSPADSNLATVTAAADKPVARFNVNAKGLVNNIDVTPKSALQNVSGKTSSVVLTNADVNPNKIQITNNSAQAVKSFNEDSGIVTIYNSGQAETTNASSSLVYSNSKPVTIANTLGADTASGVYSRLLEKDNITIHNAATIIGEFSINDKSVYISNLHLSEQQPINSIKALNNTAAISKDSARRTLHTNKANADSIIEIQNLNYITTKNKKLTVIRLFDKLSNLEKPSAIQVGFQLKETIMSGLEQTTNDSDGMINIRADKNSIGERLHIRGNYVVINNPSYRNVAHNDDENSITGNITIYDKNSTKVYVNNTTIYFDGEQAIGGIDVVDIDKNSAGLGSLELGHVIRASQYKQYDNAQVSSGNDDVSLVSFSISTTKAEKDDKPKLGA